MNFGYFSITTILLIITVLWFYFALVIEGKVTFTFQKANIYSINVRNCHIK